MVHTIVKIVPPTQEPEEGEWSGECLGPVEESWGDSELQGCRVQKASVRQQETQWWLYRAPGPAAKCMNWSQIYTYMSINRSRKCESSSNYLFFFFWDPQSPWLYNLNVCHLLAGTETGQLCIWTWSRMWLASLTVQGLPSSFVQVHMFPRAYNLLTLVIM